MPKRKCARSITDSTVSDLTISKFCPTTASSPIRNSDTSVLLNTPEDIVKAEQQLRKRLEEKLKKTCEERISAKRTIIANILSSWDSNFTLDLNDLKACRKLYKESYKSILGSSKKDEEEEIQIESPITTKEETTSSTLGRSRKKTKVALEKSEAKENSVFKKPVGRPKASSVQASAAKRSSAFRTPYSGRRRGYNIAVVTPGPDSQRPISILRRPNPGEMAISMSGSPLLITHNNVPVDVPQISIPLADGRVMTVLANEGLDPDLSICTEMDSETEERLILLQRILSKKRRKQ